MQILQTATEALDTSEIHRIAYLCPTRRTYLTRTTGHPDSAHPGLGEVIVDMGDEIVTLTYVDSELEGQLIVSRLTELIAYEIQDVIDVRRIEQEASAEAARLRAETTRIAVSWCWGAAAQIRSVKNLLSRTVRRGHGANASGAKFGQGCGRVS
jgi:hypothetical protein